MAKKDKAKKGGKAEKPEEPVAEKPADGAEGAEGEAPAKKKMAGKTLVLFIILPAVLVLGGGGAAAALLLGGKKTEAATGEHPAGEGEHGEKKKPEKKPEKKDEHGGGEGGHAEGGAKGEANAADVGTLTVGEDGDPSYYAMPKLIVNLASSSGDSQLLELSLVLEASDAAAFDEVPVAMPRLKDQFQSFLRELRVEDLNGSAGSYRLRIELLRRFNAVMAPAKADAVLIENFLVMAQ